MIKELTVYRPRSNNIYRLHLSSQLLETGEE